MNARSVSILALGLLIGAVAALAFRQTPAYAQPKPDALTPGRYQVLEHLNRPDNQIHQLVILDTATGELWWTQLPPWEGGIPTWVYLVVHSI